MERDKAEEILLNHLRKDISKSHDNEIIQAVFLSNVINSFNINSVIDAMLEFAEQSRITEQGELFKKVYIKNTNDVPSKFARYMTNIGFVSFGGVKPYNRTLSNRGAIIKWYLQPITEQSSVVVTDDVIDAKQYMINMLYSAYNQGEACELSSAFDEWVEREVNNLDEYFKSRLTPGYPEELIKKICQTVEHEIKRGDFYLDAIQSGHPANRFDNTAKEVLKLLAIKH